MLTMGFSAILLAAGTPAVMADAGPHVLVAGALKERAFPYGRDPQQTVQFYTRKRGGRPPLIVYIHGGGWTAGNPGAGGGMKPDHFTARGFAYATVGYRLVPGASVEQQLDDLARAIRGMRYDARGLGFDRDRIVLLGHSSGGHLAALLGADPRYLQRAGVPFAAIAGVVLLDSAGLDVNAIMAAIAPGDPFYAPTFGDDPARRADLSPVTHGEAPNAPAWALIYDRNNYFAGAQSIQLAGALQAGGAKIARAVGLADTSHMALNEQLGAPGDAATAIVDAFLDEAVPRTPGFR